MFYYLLYNSSLLKEGGNDKQIKLLIYGTILYIIFHGLIFSNSYLEKFQNYYWLLFSLDIGSIYFIYKNKFNGNLNINTKFYSDGTENNNDNNDENIEVMKDMNNKLSNLKLSINNYQDNYQDKDKNKDKKVSFNTEENNESNLDDLENIKMEIKDTLLYNNKAKKTEIERLNQIKKSSTTESDTDFGSDIDLDAFEKTLD